MYMLAYDDKAVKILDDIYQNYDGKKYFIFDRTMSRKTNIVPAINAYLKERFVQTQ